MEFVGDHISRPYHRLAGRLCNPLPFSVAELLYAVIVIFTASYAVYTVYALIRNPGKMRRIYIFAVTAASAALTFYALVCVLWGPLYYSGDFAEHSGISVREISTAELKAVTIYFADLASETGSLVSRDENGLYNADLDRLLQKSAGLYADTVSEFPCLAGPDLRPKSMYFSVIMSYMNFTGFFFPITGEANINTDAPLCFLPSTIAHELAHQRGVAREQDANFVAVLASLNNGDNDFVYSASLLAYTHLASALRSASYDDWVEAYGHISAQVRADLYANNEYWARFETPAADVSEAVYTGFLHSQGQTLGMHSYGACVDMLVSYYG
jgi:hypothetical protein